MPRISDEVIGLVGGSTAIVESTPTLDTNAYADADRLGSINELSSALRQISGTNANNTGVLQSLTVVDKGKVKKGFRILFFDELPTVASADNAALDITDAEMTGKYLGQVAVTSSDYVDLANSSVAGLKNIGLVLKSVSGTSIWAVLQSSEAATYAADGLVLKFGILQD